MLMHATNSPNWIRFSQTFNCSKKVDRSEMANEGDSRTPPTPCEDQVVDHSSSKIDFKFFVQQRTLQGSYVPLLPSQRTYSVL